jgi:hypothetical protein
MATTIAYWLYQGKLVTPEGKAYSNADVIATFRDKRTKTIFIEPNGEFYINFKFKERLPSDPFANPGKLDALDIDPLQSPLVSLDIFPKETDKYQPINLKNFVPVATVTYLVDNDTKLYNFGSLTLLPPFQLQSKTLQDIELVNITSPIKRVTELPKPVAPTPTAKGSKRLRKFIFSLSRRLPKYVLNLFAPFGVTIATKVIEGVRGNDLIPFKVVCPPREVLLTVIYLRNELTTILNNANKVITTANSAITIVQTSLSALNAILIVLKRIPYPSTGVPPLGLPPLTTGQINTFTETINKLQLAIRQGRVGLTTIQSLSLILAGLLATILDLLNSLDGLIQKCAEEQNVPYNLINAELIAIQGNVETSYKGFTFDIKLENLENPQYPRRYAVAINQYGIISLRSESSFTANPQTLIDQLKFIIDRDNLKAN